MAGLIWIIWCAIAMPTTWSWKRRAPPNTACSHAMPTTASCAGTGIPTPKHQPMPLASHRSSTAPICSPMAAWSSRCSSLCWRAMAVTVIRLKWPAKAVAYRQQPSGALPPNWPRPHSITSAACRLPGPTATATAIPKCRCGRWPCMPCAVSVRMPTASRPVAPCICCSCCSVRSTPRVHSVTNRRFRVRFRRPTGRAERATQKAG